MSFPFENLDVYQRSLAFIETTENICSSLKEKSSFSIRDQMTRASLSVSLNIAEGNGRWHKKDRMHFLHIARGSVFELVPIIQVMHRKGVLSPEVYGKCYEDLQVMAKMLTAFIKSIEEKMNL